ncbi:hypothetical protein PL373_19845 [Tenacibaculum maritimum]|nr:hypothetical protein [Tenacibaculum maritimum]
MKSTKLTKIAVFKTFSIFKKNLKLSCTSLHCKNLLKPILRTSGISSIYLKDYRDEREDLEYYTFSFNS